MCSTLPQTAHLVIHEIRPEGNQRPGPHLHVYERRLVHFHDEGEHVLVFMNTLAEEFDANNVYMINLTFNVLPGLLEARVHFVFDVEGGRHLATIINLHGEVASDQFLPTGLEEVNLDGVRVDSLPLLRAFNELRPTGVEGKQVFVVGLQTERQVVEVELTM